MPPALSTQTPGTGSEVLSGPTRQRRQLALGYHELTVGASDYTYALSCEQFEQHLRQVNSLPNGHALDRPGADITFDDGHISNYTLALPLLERYRLKATFFVIVGRVGQHGDCLTWTQLREMCALGHSVQAHGWSHRFLTECSDSDLSDELLRSRQTIEDQLGCAPSAISAPHGRWDRRVLKACADAGFRRLYTSDPFSSALLRGSSQPSQASTRSSREDVEVIGRLIVVQAMDASRLAHWLKMGPGEAGLRRAQYALKRSAQRVLGNRLYYSLWARFSGWTGPEDSRMDAQ